jgi:uncharacterized membrane protein
MAPSHWLSKLSRHVLVVDQECKILCANWGMFVVLIPTFVRLIFCQVKSPGLLVASPLRGSHLEFLVDHVRFVYFVWVISLCLLMFCIPSMPLRIEHHTRHFG